MKLEIITPEKSLFEGTVSEMVVPGTDGLLGILDNHAPLISTLAKGTVKVKADKGEQTFEINGGVIEVRNNKATVLAE